VVLKYLKPASETLSPVSPEFKTPCSLIKTGYYYGVLILLVGIPLALIVVGLPLIIIGVILVIIGKIEMIILSLRLNDREKNPIYIIAGILFTLSIILPLASAIAWILLYIGLNNTISKY